MFSGGLRILSRFDNTRERRRPARRAPAQAGARFSMIEITLSSSGSSDDEIDTEAAPLRRRRPRRKRRRRLGGAAGRERSSQPAHSDGEIGASSLSEKDLASYVAQVLEVVPDVDPSHAQALITENYNEFQDDVAQNIIDFLFEDPTYPRGNSHLANGHTLGGVSSSATQSPVNYASADRPRPEGPKYGRLAQEQLQADFPYIPVSHIRIVLFQKNGLYAPAYILLLEQENDPSRPYKRKTRRTAARKGKAVSDPDFDAERAWIVECYHARGTQANATTVVVAEDNEKEDPNALIECGCCFTDYTFDQMVQCPDAHLFCSACITSYASTKLGSNDANLVCMDQSGCKEPFIPSQLRRFLPEKLVVLYDRVLANQNVREAGIEGIEECPACDFKCVIDDEEEELFYCHNEACLMVSCRKCKKPDHLPRNCEEVREDTQRDAQHEINEAMTHALMRNCPKCHTAFIKEDGCNKMTCPQCATISCYVCRKVITGYDHFADDGSSASDSEDDGCPLYDDSLAARHAREVEQAAQDALMQLRRTRPDIDINKMEVDVQGPRYSPELDFSDWEMDDFDTPPPRINDRGTYLSGWHLAVAMGALSVTGAYCLLRWDPGAKVLQTCAHRALSHVMETRERMFALYGNRTETAVDA